MKKKSLVLMVSSLLLIGSICNATIVMDAEETATYVDGAWVYTPGVHNGSFLGGTTGTYWHSSPSNVPAEWEQVAIAGTYIYNGATSLQAYPNSQVLNNTGEVVATGSQYTITFGSGVYSAAASVAGGTTTASVIATENNDGTGSSVVLASASRISLAGDAVYSLNLATDIGSIAAAGINGYYVQVLVETDGAIGGQSYFFDNVVVTSEIVPEPATMAILGLGGLFLRRRKK